MRLLDEELSFDTLAYLDEVGVLMDDRLSTTSWGASIGAVTSRFIVGKQVHILVAFLWCEIGYRIYVALRDDQQVLARTRAIPDVIWK